MQYEEVTHNTITDTKVNLWGTSGIAARNNEIFSSDAHGNTDEAYGTTSKRYIYDAYGNQINEHENDDNPYRYCGENYDEETGLYYLRARYYDPSIGRFLSEDPAQDGANWYVYCGNNPITRIDSNGENWITDRINAAWDSTKWAFNTAVNYINEEQKADQRAFWHVGSLLLLHFYYGYDSSMWLLQHSLQDNPENVSRGNDSRIASLIKQDNGFLSELDKQLAEHENDSFYAEMGVTFEQGDLYYAIHRSTVKISCTKQENGQWYVYGYLYDRYDYTEFITLMGDTKNVTLGTTANDLAHISQMTGAIQPYDIEIYFDLIR